MTIISESVGEITVVRDLLDVAYPNMETERKNLEACRNKKRGC